MHHNFAYIFFILLHHCTNGNNIPPPMGFEPGPCHWESTMVSTVPQGLMILDIWIYIYCTLQTVVFARRNLATSQVQTPLSPLLLTQSRPQNCSAHLPRPWVWQISKSANCKLHLLTYLYMYRGRWLACAIYSCHWRPLFPLWCHIPAHAPGDL